jgi:hypothetical protein
MKLSLTHLPRIASFLLLSYCLLSICLTAKAGLVDGGGDLLNDLNNAIRFEPSTPTPAIVAFKDANLPLDRYIQVGFRTNNPVALNITSIGWSKDNISYTDFTPNNFVNNVNSPSQYVYSNVIDLGGTIGGTSNTLFFLRYTIPAGIEVGKTVQSIFLANSDSFTSGGVLENQVNNNFVSIARSHTAVPEPTSLLLVTTTAALLGWKLRRRQKRAS